MSTAPAALASAQEAHRLDAVYMKALETWNRTGPSDPGADDLYLAVESARDARDAAVKMARMSKPTTPAKFPAWTEKHLTDADRGRLTEDLIRLMANERFSPEGLPDAGFPVFSRVDENLAGDAVNRASLRTASGDVVASMSRVGLPWAA